MRTKSKSLLIACLALVLIASAVFGTIAYMTAQDSNTIKQAAIDWAAKL